MLTLISILLIVVSATLLVLVLTRSEAEKESAYYEKVKEKHETYRHSRAAIVASTTLNSLVDTLEDIPPEHKSEELISLIMQYENKIKPMIEEYVL